MQAEGFNLEAIACLLGGPRRDAPAVAGRRTLRGPLRRLARRRPPRRGRGGRGRRAVRPGARARARERCPTRTRGAARCVESLAMAARPPRSSSRRSRAAPPRQLRHIHEDVAHLAPELRAAGLLDGEAFRRLAAFDRHHEAMSRGRRAVDRRGAARRPALGGEPQPRRGGARSAHLAREHGADQLGRRRRPARPCAPPAPPRPPRASAR